MNTLTEHDGPVTVLATSPTLGDIATVCSSRQHKLAASETYIECIFNSIN